MATVRLPALLLLPAAVAAALVLGPSPSAAPLGPEAAAESDGELPVVPPAVLPASELVAAASPPGSRGSTWYCAPGTATGDDEGFAEHTVVIANAGSETAEVTLTALTDEGGTVSEALEVGPASQMEVALSDVVTAPWAAALIEADRGEIAVDHVFEGPTGTAVSACASTPTDRAWFPSGATEPGAREVLAIVNPFPDEAVVAITFETEQGARTPEDLQARVIPPQSAVAIELGDRVAVRAEVATTVVVAAGQVVIDRIQSFDGSSGRFGLAVSPGTPRPAPVWWFPAAELSARRLPTLVIQNPDPEEVAEVDVVVSVGGAPPEAQPEPFALDVAPGRYLTLALDRDGRIPSGSPVSVVVRSFDDRPVVAELVTQIDAPQSDAAASEPTSAPVGGAASIVGSPVVADRWLVPVALRPDVQVATISVVNPGGSPVEVSLEQLDDGSRSAVGQSVEVAAGGRVDLSVLDRDGARSSAFEVRATGPVVVSRSIVLSADEITDALAVPVRDRVEAAPPPAAG